jgi:integrase
MAREYFKGFAEFIKNDENNAVHGTSAKIYFGKVREVYQEWTRQLDSPFLEKYFDGIKFSSKAKKDKYALSWEKLKQLENLQFGESTNDKKREKIRDIFLFMCYTSRYYTEIKDLTFEKNYFLQGENKEKPALKGKRNKTGEFFINPIYPNLLKEILNKHNPEKTGKIFKKIQFHNPSSSINPVLKDFSKAIDLNFVMTIKTARITFKSVIAERMDPKVIKLIMGHNNERSQGVYVANSESPFDDLVKAWDRELT